MGKNRRYKEPGAILQYWAGHLKNIKVTAYVWLSTIVIYCIGCTPQEKEANRNWEVYGGTKDANHYSTLSEIDTSNVNQLKIAWTFRAGDADTTIHTQIQCNPIIVDGVLYGTTAKMKLFALDAATGKQKWIFEPLSTGSSDMDEKNPANMTPSNNGRGVAWWTDGQGDKRLFYSFNDHLICVNAVTGKPCADFGDKGRIDLHYWLGRDVADRFVTSNTPGIIYHDILIVGTRVAEDASAAPGHIRAFNVRNGQLIWIFHTIPHPGEIGYETLEDPNAWKHLGAANCWAGMSLDEKKGIVFIPTGSISFDFFGGKRAGDGLFANCVLALEAATGKYIWHFQTVHHDVWDRDNPTAPVLVNILKDGKKIEALAQATKSGFIFLLDRASGRPIYPVEERMVPAQSELAGERLSMTQPFPTFPKPFVRQILTEADLNDLVPASSYQDIKNRLAGYKTGNMFNPPSFQGTIIFPGFDGGAEWGGPAYDPTTGILYVNASEMPWVLEMIEVKEKTAKQKQENFLEAGRRLYTLNCLSCHGPERKGGGNFPSLIGANKRYNEKTFHELISSGRGMMPAFNHLSDQERNSIASFILDLRAMQTKKFISDRKADEADYLHLPYTNTGYNKFKTKEGYPAIKPPWGTITAINLNTGEFVWKDTLGDYPELKARGIHSGTENYGGPVVTAGGLLFIAATSDSKIRAFNKKTGRLLWETDLPASGFATPSVYHVNGRQYVVIACGGGKLGTKSGDSYVAFALPE